MGDPQKIGKYQIVEKIGAGGCGIVYRARDPHIQRDVAIKILVSEDEGLRQRFLREAQFIGNLNHPNIISIFDLGFEKETPFLVEELLSGANLSTLIRTQAEVDLDEKLGYLVQIAEGLGFAHRAGILHRDIKPSNIQVLESGRVKLMDFGIAKELSPKETQLTQHGALVGTMGYMAPELIHGEELDGRADIFSFGALAYELLTWKRPFPADDLPRMIRAVIYDATPAIREAWPACPEALAELVTRCLAKKPEERYANFDEVRGRLEAIRVDPYQTDTLVATPAAAAAPADVPAAAPADVPAAAPADTPAAVPAEIPAAVPADTPAAVPADAPAAVPADMQSAAPREGETISDFRLAGSDPVTGPEVSPEYEAYLPESRSYHAPSRRLVFAGVAAVVLVALAGVWLAKRPGGDPAGAEEAVQGGVETPADAEEGAAVAATPPAVPHTVAVSSTPPGAAIWLDGRDLALTTPAEVTLEGGAGTEVEVELRSGGEIVASRAFVLGTDLPAAWEPEPLVVTESYRIVSNPAGARILVDGEPTGEATPALIEFDSATAYDLRLELDGYKPARFALELSKLDPAQREERQLFFPLTASVPPGTLVVDATYPVRLQVGRQRFDVDGQGEISLPPGSHSVEVSAPEVYYSARRAIDVTSGERSRLRLPPAVAVRVIANPSHCRLSIDGRDVDWLPTEVRLAVGRHEFEFVWESLGKSTRIEREVRADTERVFASADG